MTIPTVQTVRDQIISYTEARLGQTVPRLQRAFIFVMATAVAGVIVLAYYFANWCLDQTQPATCNEFWLGIWGDRYGVPRSPAVAAVLILTVTGTDGSIIPTGTLYQNAAGTVYQVQADVTITGGVAAPQVICLTSGIIGNLAPAAPMTLVSPIAGVVQAAVVASTDTDGVDRESVASWREQIILRIRYRPQGGAIPDYIIWALEVPGVVKAFAQRTGANDVTVYPLDAITGPSRLPDAPLLAAVLAYLNDPVRKPLAANVYTLAPTERTCAITITGATIGGAALSAGQKQAIQDATDAYLYAAYPKQYPDEPAPTDTVSTAAIWTALAAYGATATAVTISVSGIGGGPYTLPLGEIIKPNGTITWA